MASNLKERHERLLRSGVKAVSYLQGVLADYDTPEHVKPGLMTALSLLEYGLLDQPMQDERVLIEVIAGVARVAEKTEFVQVTIDDLDSRCDG